MPWVKIDGMAEHVDWDSPELTRAHNSGSPVHGTLAGLVIHQGVDATAFSRAVVAEDLFDGHLAVMHGVKRRVGTISAYRIEAVRGQQFVPPRARADFVAAQEKGCAGHPDGDLSSQDRPG